VLSTFAFNLKLRRYNADLAPVEEEDPRDQSVVYTSEADAGLVRTPSLFTSNFTALLCP